MEQFHSLRNASLRQQYEEAGFFGRVGYGTRPALLVIDMARNWTDPSEMYGADLSSVMQAIKQLLRNAREVRIPIVFTTMGFDSELREVGENVLRKAPGAKAMVRGAARLELEPELERQASEALIDKQRGSAFFGTNLLSMLIDQRVDTVIVTGCSTSGCIRQTVTDAHNLNFRVIVPREAVGDRSWSAHEANLFDIDARYADVVPLDEATDYLIGI